MAKIYLAARFGRQAELREYRVQLLSRGHEVTSGWLDVPPDEDGNLDRTRQAVAAINDLTDLRSATVMVNFTERPDRQWSRGGRHVELGVAIEAGLAIHTVGPMENIFHCLPQVISHERWEGCLDWLSIVTPSARSQGGHVCGPDCSDRPPIRL